MICAHKRLVRAKRVSAIVHKGHMFGVESVEKDSPLRRLQPVQWEQIVFCASPVCEKVFHSERVQ